MGAVIAMTDGMDIKRCKVVRKLAVGEVVSAEEPPTQDPVSGVTRVKCKARKDGAEGWVTLKGNAGTVYAESSSKHYFVVQEVPLHTHWMGTAKNRLRMLSEGETLEVLEGPK